MLFLGNTKFTMSEQGPNKDMARLIFLRTRVLDGTASDQETEEFDLLVRKIVDYEFDDLPHKGRYDDEDEEE